MGTLAYPTKSLVGTGGVEHETARARRCSEGHQWLGHHVANAAEMVRQIRALDARMMRLCKGNGDDQNQRGKSCMRNRTCPRVTSRCKKIEKQEDKDDTAANFFRNLTVILLLASRIFG